MTTFKAKLTTLLMTIGCFAVCLGAGVVVATCPEVTQVTASAEATVHDLGALTLHVNSKPIGGAGKANNQLYLERVDGGALPLQSWDYLFTADTDGYFLINGEAKTPFEIKSTDAGFFWLFDALNAGDTVTIGGTFKCESQGLIYNISESRFVWNGTNWEAYLVHNLGALTLHVNSKPIGGAGKANNQLYLERVDGGALPLQSWDYLFTADTDGYFLINGEAKTPFEIKSTDAGFFWLFDALNAGDTVTIGGTFKCESQGLIYNISESKFTWNGTNWVAYTTHNLGRVVAVADGSASSGYLQFADGITLPVNSWDYAFMLFSGNGITVDGAPIDMTNNVKSVGNKLYVTLTPTPASVDSTLAISGTFYNEDLAIKYVIEESKFTWNGSAWVDYIDYTTYNIGALTLHANSIFGGAAGFNNQLYLKRADGEALPVQDWSVLFTHDSGEGFKINSEATTAAEIKSTPDGFFWSFGALQAGDVVSISGTFACPTQAVKYVIEESKFVWNGSAWENYIDYTTHEIGKLTYNDGNATCIYLKRADGQELEIATTENNLHWTTAFAFQADSGVGITLNGTQISMNDIKFPGNMYIGLGTTAKAGDVLAIGGTFYSNTLAYKYIIEESKFIFNGSTWSDLQSSYTISNLQPTANSTAKAPVYLKINGDTNLPIMSDYLFSHIDGAGFVRDGSQLKMTAIKSTADGFNFKFAKSSSIVANDVFTLSGTFYCETLDVTFIIEECTITWTGSTWEKYIAYNTYTFNALNGANGCTSSVLYAYPTDGDTLPGGDWDNRFTLESGAGLKLNDVVLSGWEIKQPGDFYIVLNATANKGDIFTIDGTFVNETTAKKFVFNDCKLQFNGTTWVTKVEVQYTTYDIGELVLHVNSSTGAASGNNNQLYLQRADGGALPVEDWSVLFTHESGDGFQINGKALTANEIKSTDAGFFLLFNGLQAGDIVSISGTFVCDDKAVKYNIEESNFIWTGSGWALLGKDYSDLIEGVVYDTVTIVDLGFSVEEKVTGLVEGAGLNYLASADNTTGSLKFRLGINAENISAGAYDIRFRGTAWDGIRFIIGNGVLQSYYLEARKTVPLSSKTYYEIELGIIDTADGNSLWIYAKVDGALYISDLVAKTQNKYDDDEGEPFGEYNTNHVSFYGNLGTVMLYDPDRTEVTYTTDYGTNVVYAPRNAEYTLPQGKTYDTFIGWLATDGTIYTAGQTVVLTGSISFTAITIDFSLEAGAAIRLNTSKDSSGIRFTTNIKAADLAALEAYGITVNAYGTLIMPFDYLARGQAPNLNNFTAGSAVLQIVSTYSETVGDYVVYRGAMQKLKEGNYARLFAGRGYMELTINGENVIVYTPFDMEDNVRSIRNVAYKFQKDTAEYNKLSTEKKDVVDAYAAQDEIKLINYSAYSNNNFLQLIAWYYPELDSSNAYNNATNIAIAKKIKDAGMTAVYLDGMHHLDLNTQVNIEKTRQIIKFFWSQGLYTIAFGSNASTNLYIDYSTNAYPDFSDCEGFMGYLVWDEPQTDSFGTLANFANKFESVYAGTGATFMANLLPSYASIFNGTSNWWDSSMESLDKDAYKAYIEQYCTTVLSQVDGEKWLSMDSYPINANKSLMSNFLFDLALLKYYSMQYEAHAHAVLQSSGWTEDGNSSKNRMPTEAEMRMQAYAAMAFGMDSISWWSYSDKRDDNQSNPTDSDEYYTRFANVNKELSAISAVYSAFDWKGVILGAGKDNGKIFNEDADYTAYDAVKGQIGDYELSASDTKLLSGVSTDKTDWNYLMGVMEDMNGNEGYVICNYNSHEENRAQTLTLTFNKNVTEVVIYRGGVAQTVSVNDKTLTISLATGEGVIVLPSKIG